MHEPIETNMSLIDKYEMLKYSYIRSSNTVAEYLIEYCQNETLLIFGVNRQTTEVLTLVIDYLNITGILVNSHDVAAPSTHLNNIPIISTTELSSVAWDRIVLLGLWNEIDMNCLANNLHCQMDKLFPVYQTNWMQKRIRLSYEHITNAKNHLNLAHVKPCLALFLAVDRKDLITLSAKEVSNYFSMTKIYTNTGLRYKEENQYFDAVMDLSGNIKWCVDWLEKNKPKVVVFWISSQFEFWQAWYLKQHLANNIVFILGTSDLFFTLYHMDIDRLGRCIEMNEDITLLNSNAEKNLLDRCDAVISNLDGLYAKEILSKNQGSHFFSYGFVRPEKITWSQPLANEEIHLCLTGSVEFINDPVNNPIRSSSWYIDIFTNLLEQGYILHVYTSNKPTRNNHNPYEQLEIDFNGRYHHHGFVPASQLIKEISKYHFGLGLMNLNPPIPKIYHYQLRSMLHARLITYLCAGLPVIINSENKFANDFLAPHDVALSISQDKLNEFSQLTSLSNYSELKNNVRKFQSWYQTERPHQQLAKFIHDLV